MNKVFLSQFLPGGAIGGHNCEGTITGDQPERQGPVRSQKVLLPVQECTPELKRIRKHCFAL